MRRHPLAELNATGLLMTTPPGQSAGATPGQQPPSTQSRHSSFRTHVQRTSVPLFPTRAPGERNENFFPQTPSNPPEHPRGSKRPRAQYSVKPGPVARAIIETFIKVVPDNDAATCIDQYDYKLFWDYWRSTAEAMPSIDLPGTSGKVAGKDAIKDYCHVTQDVRAVLESEARRVARNYCRSRRRSEDEEDEDQGLPAADDQETRSFVDSFLADFGQKCDNRPFRQHLCWLMDYDETARTFKFPYNTYLDSEAPASLSPLATAFPQVFEPSPGNTVICISSQSRVQSQPRLSVQNPPAFVFLKRISDEGPKFLELCIQPIVYKDSEVKVRSLPASGTLELTVLWGGTSNTIYNDTAWGSTLTLQDNVGLGPPFTTLDPPCARWEIAVGNLLRPGESLEVDVIPGAQIEVHHHGGTAGKHVMRLGILSPSEASNLGPTYREVEIGDGAF